MWVWALGMHSLFIRSFKMKLIIGGVVWWSGGGEEGANMWVWVLGARALALRGGQWSRRGAGGWRFKYIWQLETNIFCNWGIYILHWGQWSRRGAGGQRFTNFMRPKIWERKVKRPTIWEKLKSQTSDTATVRGKTLKIVKIWNNQVRRREHCYQLWKIKMWACTNLCSIFGTVESITNNQAKVDTITHVKNGSKMTVEMNMFPLHHHHHHHHHQQQALHQLAQLQGGGLPLHQPLTLGQQQQEHQQMFQKHHHQFGKADAASKVSIVSSVFQRFKTKMFNFKTVNQNLNWSWNGSSFWSDTLLISGSVYFFSKVKSSNSKLQIQSLTWI